MVISRTTNTLKDGTKKRIVYYACGNWKNKGTAVCHSNMIRVEKANAVVYQELEKILSNERFLKGVLENVNKKHGNSVQESKKHIEKYNVQLKKLDSRVTKIYEAYEEGVLTGDELIKRKKVITEETEVVEKRKQEELSIIAEERGRIYRLILSEIF